MQSLRLHQVTLNRGVDGGGIELCLQNNNAAVFSVADVTEMGRVSV